MAIAARARCDLSPWLAEAEGCRAVLPSLRFAELPHSLLDDSESRALPQKAKARV